MGTPLSEYHLALFDVDPSSEERPAHTYRKLGQLGHLSRPRLDNNRCVNLSYGSSQIRSDVIIA